MFECPLCKEWLYYGRVCDKCIPIRNIVACYGIDKVNDVLNNVFLRVEEKVENKSNAERMKLRSSNKE